MERELLLEINSILDLVEFDHKGINGCISSHIVGLLHEFLDKGGVTLVDSPIYFHQL